MVHAVARALNDDSHSLVHETVHGGAAHQRIREDSRPFGPVAIARHNRGHLFVALADDFVQVILHVRIER